MNRGKNFLNTLILVLSALTLYIAGDSDDESTIDINQWLNLSHQSDSDVSYPKASHVDSQQKKGLKTYPFHINDFLGNSQQSPNQQQHRSTNKNDKIANRTMGIRRYYEMKRQASKPENKVSAINESILDFYS